MVRIANSEEGLDLENIISSRIAHRSQFESLDITCSAESFNFGESRDTLFHESPLFYAITHLQNNTVKRLLTNGETDATMKSRIGGTLIHVAADSNNSEIIEFLKDRGVPLDAYDEDSNTALHIAASRGHVSVVHVLLELGASTTLRNIYYRIPEEEAANDGHYELADLINVRSKYN